MKKLYVFLVGLLCGATFAHAQCTISVNANPSYPVCAGYNTMVYAHGAHTYLWTPGGMTDSVVTVHPTVSTTYTVVGTDLLSNTCSGTITLNIIQPTVPTFNIVDTLCYNAPIPQISNTSINGITGSWNPATVSNQYSGTYVFTPNIGYCATVYTHQITVIGANFSYGGPYCPGGINPFPTLAAEAIAGVFSAPVGLVFISTSTGQVDLSASTPGTYTVTNSIPAIGGCPPNYATNTITIHQTPTVTVPANIVVCAGDVVPAAVIIPYPGGYGTTFTWTNSNSAIGITPSGVGTIPSFVATNSSTSPITATITVTSSQYGCMGTPSSYTITVNPYENPSFVYASSTICQLGADVVPLILGGSTGTWSATPAGLVFLDNTTGLIDVSASAANTYTLTFITSAPCPSQSTTTITIVSGAVVSVAVPSNIVACNTTVIPATNFVSTPSGASFTWTNSNTAIGLAASGSGDIPSFTATNTTTSVINAIITVTPSLGSYCISPSMYTIQVTPPTHVYVPANIVICNNGTVVATNFLSSPVGASFTWTNSNTAIGLAASSSGNIPSFTATNATSSPIYSTITVTPILNGCPGVSSCYTIYVNPTPHVTVSNITVCVGRILPSTWVSTPSNATFSWTSDAVIDTIMPGLAATNSTSSPITGTIVVTPTWNGCPGVPSSYIVTVNPIQTVNANYTPNPVCSGQNIQLSSSPSGATSYSWTGPSGFTSTIQNPAISPPSWSSGTFTVSATYSGYLCTNTVTVYVHPNPVPSITTNYSTVCPGSCAALTASAGSGITYLWQPGSHIGASYTTCPATNTTYTVLATSSYGCTGTATTNISVYPNFSFVVTPSNVTIPSGQCTTLNIGATGSFVWTPSVGLNTNVGASVLACPTSTTSYTVMGTNINGCTGTATVTVHVVDKYIDDVSGSSSCHLPFLGILNIADNFVQQNDTILYHLDYGDGSDTTFNIIYQNNPTPVAAITHAYTTMGTYSPWAILQHTNGLSDTIHAQDLIVASDTCGNISGRVFYDVNSNCLPDTNEFKISNALMKLYNPSHALVQAQFTDAEGFYNFDAPNGNYTLEIDSLIYNSFGLGCPAGGTYTIASVPAIGKHYGLNCTAGFDLYGNVSSSAFHPVNYANIWLTIGNLLCTPANANVKFILDPRTSYVSSYMFPPVGINGDTISWTVNSLSVVNIPFQHISLSVLTSPSAIVNDSLSFTLIVNPIGSDVNPINNTVVHKHIITGSFDPNAKEVSPAGDITKNTDLTYTVHFQNTGNAEAYNIYILDTLDAHLDLSTLEMVAASHPYSVEILNSTQKDVLKFFFPNIMLPDSGSNQMLSNGFVSYKIRPLANCVEGTIITNLADIYFDYNPAIPTNMVQNQIPLILGVNQETNNSTRDRVIPNPVSQQATLTYAVPEQGKTLIKLFDITGKETLTLLNQDLDQGEHHLSFDCKDLKSGIYFIRITNIRSSSVVKLVKM